MTVDSATSVELFEHYLDEAGNYGVYLVVLVGVGDIIRSRQVVTGSRSATGYR